MTTADELSAGLALPGEPYYESAAAVFNLAARANPAIAVNATSVGQIQAAIQHAAARGLPVRVHATGHAAGATRPIRDGLLIRTALDEDIEIDAGRRVIRIPAGARWGEVVRAAAPYGLAVPHGSSPTVGAVGYLLRGGLSFYGRKVGLAVNSVRAIEMITADGALRRVDARHDPELFWALRGGGGGFGVVTAVEIELFDAAAVFTGAAFWPAGHAARLLAAWRRWAGQAPAEATTSIRVMNMPEHPAVPPVLSAGTIFCVDGALVAGDGGEPALRQHAEDLLGPLRAIAAPVLDTWHLTHTEAVLEAHMDPVDPVPIIGDHMLLGDIGDEGAAEFLRMTGPGSGSPLIVAGLRQLGGAYATPPAGAGALGHIAASYSYAASGVPFPPLSEKTIREYLGRVREALRPWDTGRTVPSFVEHFAQPQRHLTPDQVAAADRVRKRVDPVGLFSGDIAPGASAMHQVKASDVKERNLKEMTTMSNHVGDRAVVLGGSMAGLLAARILADAYGEVVVVDRDQLSGTTPRRGVPQGNHVHGLLARGQQILEELFPGFTQAAIDDGVPTADLGELRWYFNGLRLEPGTTGLTCVSAARPVLESYVRDRVAALPNVTFRDRCDIAGLITNADNSQVTGVEVQPQDAGGEVEEITADLVIDATGRGSRTPAWLEELGYERPAEERIKINLTYTTRHYRLPDESILNGDMSINPVSTPSHHRGAFFSRIEKGTCVLSLTGVLGDSAPTDPAGFIDWVKSLPVPDVYDVIKDAEPLDDAVSFRYPASVRRHYEQLTRLPGRLLILGDAACSFNPVYGQGMTVAALEALTLREHLQAGVPQPLEFQRDIASVIDVPWNISAGGDLAYPEVEGPRPPIVQVMNQYMARLQVAATKDGAVTRTFMRVAGLVDPPTELMSPEIVGKVLQLGGEPDPALEAALAAAAAAAQEEAAEAAPAEAASPEAASPEAASPEAEAQAA